ncbi:MAG: glycoside hydrolase family 25 protein [Bacteroidia bacterium]
MKKTTLYFLFLFAVLSVKSQTPWDQPWKDSTRAIIIDPYCDNPINFDQLITDKRVVAIIHKASQGYSADKEYAHREYLAKQKGLLWGSYHMAMKGDPVKQADFYLNTAQIDSTELMALDLEGLDTNYFMSLKNAERFINRIHERTGRYPLVYCNNSVLEEISKNYNDSSIFSKCGLWYARFLKKLPAFSQSVWIDYSLWQFSCEVNCQKTGECLYNVPGTLYDMDVNVYNGSIEELRKRWPDIALPAFPVSTNFEWLNSFDLDGDDTTDQVSLDYSGGAHCCYKIHITLSSDKKEYTFPFEMDGGYPMGVDDSQQDQFHISNLDADPLPEIFMKIQSYNGELSPIPKKWQKEYGIKTNRIIIDYDPAAKSMTVRDRTP